MTVSLSQFKVLTFDCYGTLIDWESGIWDALQPLLARNGVEHIDRSAGLRAFARFETEHEAATPDALYPLILERTHVSLSEHFELDTDIALNQRFGASVPHWPAFPDTADALRRLRHHYKLVILSNVNRDGFAASNAKLGVEFDAIYTAEDVGFYKPNDANFEYMLEHLKRDFGFEPDDVLHTAQSLHHDHVPARRFGLHNAWIDRQYLSEGGDWGATAEVPEQPTFDFVNFCMASFADATDDAFGASGRE